MARIGQRDPKGGAYHEIQFTSYLLDGDEYQAASADEALEIASRASLSRRQ